MSDVIFDTDADLQEPPKRFYRRAYGGITDWLIKNDFAENEREANIVMLAATSSILMMAFLVFVINFSVSKEMMNQQLRFIEWERHGHGAPPADFMPLPTSK